jgi:hypothetical protein
VATFSDSKGRAWNISLDHRAIKACREIDIDIVSVEGIQKLAGDYLILCETAWKLCSAQAAALNITEEEFYSGIAGDTLEAVANAIIQAITDFFPQSRRRLLMKLMDKSRALEKELLEKAEQEIEKIA